MTCAKSNVNCDEVLWRTVDGVSVRGKLVYREFYSPDQFGIEREPRYCITARYKNKTYKYTARNIFDVGLVINPPDGGLATNVEEFIRNNSSYTFRDPVKREAFRRAHPTKTGWGWNRNFAEKGPEWVSMSTDEIHVYQAIRKVLPAFMHEMRL